MTPQEPNLRPDQDTRFDGALQLASRFVALMKSGLAYSIRHISFTQQLENYLVLLEPLLQSHGHVRFDAPDGDLCMNSERLPFRQAMHRALEQLAQEFAARTLVGIEFTPGLTLAEFQSFMELFLLGERWKGQELITACHDAGIVHLQALPFRSAAADRGTEDAAASLPATLGVSREAWATLYAGTQTLLAGDALDHGIELRHVKRMAQPLVDSALAGDRIIAALARVTPGESVSAHAAHTALVAVSVGARLGLDRQDLIDIAVAALLHDVGHAWVDRAAAEPGAAQPAPPHTIEGARRIAWATTFNRSSLAAMRTAIEHHGGSTSSPTAPAVLFSQLVGMADAYVSLLSRGTTRAQWISPSSALARVLDLLRTNRQPALAVAMVRALGFYPPGQLVELDDGAIARALVPVVDDPERPWVTLVADERGALIPSGGSEAVPLWEGRRIALALPRDLWPVDDAERPAA